MLKFINRLTGTVMYVAEDRKEEYLAAGHKLNAPESPAASAEKPKTSSGTKAK